MKTNKRKFALLINYGIEYRLFFTSGLYDALKKENYGIVVFKRDIANGMLDNDLAKRDVTVIKVEPKIFQKEKTFFERYFHPVRQSRMKKIGIGIFRNYNPQKTSTVKEWLLGNALTYRIMKTIVDLQNPKRYEDQQIVQLLKENGITDLIISGYASTGSKLFAINAMNINAKVWTLVNSWKDFYINDYVPFSPDAIFVWSETMKANYLKMNKQLNPAKIIPTGYLPYDRLFNRSMMFSRGYYQEKYDFSANVPVLLYTMLDPDRYPGEHLIIENIAKRLLNEFPDDTPVVLVKKNPYDGSPSINEYFSNAKNIRVVEHFSERNKEEDFFVQSLEGEFEWTDLLQLSSMTIGAASTVALESLIVKRPVVTVAFDEKGVESDVLMEMAKAPFYKKLLVRDDVALATSLEQCIQTIKQFLNNEVCKEALPDIVGETKGDALSTLMGILKNG